MPNATVQQAQEAIDNELDRLLREGITQYEVEKCVNKHIATERFENLGYLQQAMRLCLYEQLGDAALINHEENHYRALTPDDIMTAARQLLQPTNCSTLIYSKA